MTIAGLINLKIKYQRHTNGVLVNVMGRHKKNEHFTVRLTVSISKGFEIFHTRPTDLADLPDCLFTEDQCCP